MGESFQRLRAAAHPDSDFLGFYAMLGSAIELRNSSFLWVQDLSQPDTVFQLCGVFPSTSSHRDGGTMIWQMVITPKSGDADATADLLFHASDFPGLLL